MSDRRGDTTLESGAAPAAALPYALPDTNRPFQAGDTHGLTRRDVAALSLRLVGLYALLQGMYLFTYLPALLVNYRSYRASSLGMDALLFWMGPYVLSLGAGLLLLLFADRLAPRVLPAPAAGDGGAAPAALVRTSGPELQAIAFSVVGLLLVVWSAKSLALLAWALYRAEPGVSFPNAEWGKHAMEFVVECGLGVWLFFGSKQLARFWQRLRGPAGASPAEPPPRASDAEPSDGGRASGGGSPSGFRGP
jgi:hypothetical protein